MPNLKNYPAGFNPTRFYQSPPIKKLPKNFQIVFEKDFCQYEELILPELEENQRCIVDYISSNDDDKYVTIRVVNSVEVDNPNYEKELTEYNNKLAAWKKLKERWDKEIAEEQESKEYKDYLKLKKKFEKRECVTLKKNLP